MTARNYRIVLDGVSGRHWWKLKARNGKILAHSEVYSTRRAALHTARLLAEALGVFVEDGTDGTVVL